MGNSNGIIKKPVSFWADLAKILKVASGDTGRLCLAKTINKWAKYKPIPFNKWHMVDSERDLPMTYDGHTLSNGMIVPRYHGALLFKQAIDNGDGEHYYEYMRPTGGASAPYRSLDFTSSDYPERGYFHEAKRPIEGFRGVVTQENYVISFEVNPQVDNNQVKLLDLVPDGDTEKHLDEYYLGALIVRKETNGNDVLLPLYINQRNYGSQSTITIPRSDFQDGSSNPTYVIYPFFSNSNDPLDDLWLVPIEGVGSHEYVDGKDFTIAAKAIWLDPDGVSMTRARLEYSITTHVTGFNDKGVMIQLIDLVTGNQVGTSSQFTISLGKDESYPTLGYASLNKNNNTGHNCTFRITVNGIAQDIAIKRQLIQ